MVLDPDQNRESPQAPADKDEQLIRDAFAALPVVPCPNAVVRRIEQATSSSETETSQDRSGQRTRKRPGVAAGARRSWRRWISTGGGVAAAAVIAWLLLAVPGERTVLESPRATGGAELASRDSEDGAAVRETLAGLALATRLLERSEQIMLEEVIAKPLPIAVRSSLRKTVSLVQGGRG